MINARDYIEGAFKDNAQNEIGINGFTMLARVSERVTQTSDMPTTYLEDGSHANDHIIINPTAISIEGNISDLHVGLSPAVSAVRRAQEQAGNVLQYLPERTQTQASKVSGLLADFSSAVERVDAVLNTGQRVGGYLGLTDPDIKGNIENFIDMLNSVQNSKALISIEMPHRTLDLMCITSIELTRDNQQNAMTFKIDAQQFRFAKTKLVAVAAKNPSASTGGQTDGVKDKGIQAGKKVEKSGLTQIIDWWND
jgi:hypothetical protein